MWSLARGGTDIGVDNGARTEGVARLRVVVKEPVRVVREQVQAVELGCGRFEFGYQVRVDGFISRRDFTGDEDQEKAESRACRG